MVLHLKIAVLGEFTLLSILWMKEYKTKEEKGKVIRISNLQHQKLNPLVP